MTQFEIGQPVVIVRDGDPAIPVHLDGATGRVLGFSTRRLRAADAPVPTVHVIPDGPGVRPLFVVRWHVRPVEETRGERAKRKLRAWLKARLG